MWEVERSGDELTLNFAKLAIGGIEDFEKVLFSEEAVRTNICADDGGFELWDGQLADRYVINLSCNCLKGFDIEEYVTLLIKRLGDENIRSKLRGIVLSTNEINQPVEKLDANSYPALEYILAETRMRLDKSARPSYGATQSQ